MIATRPELGPFGLPFALPHLHPVALGILLAWSLVWKGLALWRAARAEQTAWYIVLLVVNTAGLLEIVYLLFFVRRPASGTGEETGNASAGHSRQSE